MSTPTKLFLAVHVDETGKTTPAVVRSLLKPTTSWVKYEHDATSEDVGLPGWPGFDFGVGARYFTGNPELLAQARQRLGDTK
jgi:hypothetical protein